MKATLAATTTATPTMIHRVLQRGFLGSLSSQFLSLSRYSGLSPISPLLSLFLAGLL
jgi:hypothetical protein